MSYLNYEFEIFDDLLTGCLNPSTLNETRIHELVETLKENKSECLNMVIGEFDTSVSRHVLKKKWQISNHHPLAENSSLAQFNTSKNVHLNPNQKQQNAPKFIRLYLISQ